MVSLKQYLKYNTDVDQVCDSILSLHKQLELIHSKGYYVQEINADQVLYDNVLQFSDVAKLSDVREKDVIFQKNIKDLVKLSLGVFVSLDTGTNILVDYTKMDDIFLKENYNWIRESIPENIEYYDAVMNSKMFGGTQGVDYMNTYINKNAGSSKGNSNKLVKSTAAGRAMIDIRETAFVNTIFFPLIVVAIIMFIGVVYLIYLYIQG